MSVTPLSTSGLFGSWGVKPWTQPPLMWRSLALSSSTGSWSLDLTGTPPTSLCVPHWSTDLAPISFVTSESDFSKCGHKCRGLSASSMMIVSTILNLPHSRHMVPRNDHSAWGCDLGMASSLWSSVSVTMIVDFAVIKGTETHVSCFTFPFTLCSSSTKPCSTTTASRPTPGPQSPVSSSRSGIPRPPFTSPLSNFLSRSPLPPPHSLHVKACISLST